MTKEDKKQSVTETTDEEFHSWGATWSKAISYSASWGCRNPECDWEFVTTYRSIENDCRKVVVGFHYAIQRGQKFPDILTIQEKHDWQNVGYLIIECPQCFEKFWFHVSREWIEVYRKFIPQWPKT